MHLRNTMQRPQLYAFICHCFIMIFVNNLTLLLQKNTLKTTKATTC